LSRLTRIRSCKSEAAAATEAADTELAATEVATELPQFAVAPCIAVERSFEGARLSVVALIMAAATAIRTINIAVEAATTVAVFIGAAPWSEVAPS
jgi:hypothetical protein